MEYQDEEPGADVKLLMAEMKNQNFDVIRFASYRTACKLRFIQKRCQLHLVDLWNLIEAFRENAFNAMDAQAPLGVTRVRALLNSLYYQLNKRLPPSQQLDLPHCVSLLLNWLLASYDPEQQGCLRVLSLKVALAILCAGKLLDKLRYLFSLLADGSGRLPVSRFGQLLEEALVLPASVLESPSFHYSESLPNSIFHQSRVTLNEFLSVLTSDGGPECLIWMPLLHRMANVENVLHPVQCDGCNRDSFLGFRYKCQRCYNYQLCQDCFWRGRTSGSHTNQHEMKEYAIYKSASKQLGHSLRKSFRCVPERPSRPLPHFPEEEHTLDLAHIVPPSPAASHNGLPSLIGPSMDSGQDEEHRLIARYAARLAQRPTGSTDTTRQRELLAELEAKNRTISGVPGQRLAALLDPLRHHPSVHLLWPHTCRPQTVWWGWVQMCRWPLAAHLRVGNCVITCSWPPIRSPMPCRPLCVSYIQVWVLKMRLPSLDLVVMEANTMVAQMQAHRSCRPAASSQEPPMTTATSAPKTRRRRPTQTGRRLCTAGSTAS
ncbi:dystrobrevin beta isoform X4 [Dermacentor silvarum]|uniref:dystrobrevin beta isoform X4 n=1 Tax=Dermacentor silvarum TaxID=543639 RepID=UPI00210179CA|nr:dystrobrevin beta isoform X4 [Dermacentor silvarum]